MQSAENWGGDVSTERRLLLALAEELKLPLLHVSHQTDLHEQQGLALPDIRTSAQHALLLIDSFVLSQTLHQEQLALEPVSISSVLYDVAHELTPLAKQYDCRLELAIDGRHVPVISHRKALIAALTSMSTAFIASVKLPKQTVTLGAHKTGAHITAGVFSNTPGLSDKVLQQSRALYGRARQPLQSFTAHPAAGIFVADSLFTHIGNELRTSQHHNQKGLAVVLTPSRQLQLV